MTEHAHTYKITHVKHLAQNPECIKVLNKLVKDPDFLSINSSCHYKNNTTANNNILQFIH